MTRSNIVGLLCFWALLLPAAAFSKGKERAQAAVQLQVAPTELRSDMAYILLKTSTAKSGMFPLQHVLMREPSAQEVANYLAAKQKAYDDALPEMQKKAKDSPILTFDQFGFDYQGTPNSFVVISKKFLEDGDMRTILLEVRSAKYILYGITLGDRGLVTCNCLGTVSFKAKSGVITNIGSLYGDKVHKQSPVPNLEDNLGEQMFQYGFILGQALVPADAGTMIPLSLKGLPTESAQFEVVEQYYEPGAAGINRLAPIQGLLGYTKGRPVDLRKSATN